MGRMVEYLEGRETAEWSDAESLVESALETAGDIGPVLDMLGEPATVAAIFDALTGFLGAAAQRHFERRLEVVAAPGAFISGQVQPGDILIGRAMGEGGLAWADLVEFSDLALEDDEESPRQRRRGRPRRAVRRRRRIRPGRRVPHNSVVVRPRRAPSVVVPPAVPSYRPLPVPWPVGSPPPPAVAAEPPGYAEPPGLDEPPVVNEPNGGDEPEAAYAGEAVQVFPVDSYDLRVPVLPEPGEEEGEEEADLVVRPWSRTPPSPTQAPAAGAAPAACAGLSSPLVFDKYRFDGDELPAEHRAKLRQLAECIVASLGTPSPINNLDAVGHTDPVGDDVYNLDLGKRRATKFKRALLDEIESVQRGASSGIIINDSSKGETEILRGQPAEKSRRVEVFFRIPIVPPAPTATIEIVNDHDDNHVVDGRSPVATFTRFGIWDNAYDASGNVRNGAAETANFVGSDERRFYFRVRDTGATRSTVTIRWKTLRSDRRDDDVPASQDLTLTETAAGSKVFVSRAVMLVTDDIDANQATHSGLASGVRNRGQSDHRLRRATMDGFVRGEYTPAGGGRAVTVELPLFQRTPSDERRRVRVRVINYGDHATAAQIAGEFTQANLRWNQIGLKIEAQATLSRRIPAGVLNADGVYPGVADSANERAALNDLVPITPDNTVTAVWIQCNQDDFNAYVPIAPRAVALGDRYFIFMDADVDLDNYTLAHELHHVLFNRFDEDTQRRFYTFNTNAPGGAPGDPRIYRRIHDLHTPDPDVDPRNDNIINWARRRRTARQPARAGFTPGPDATTGNTLVENL
ncbi:MAG: hypothetical protein HY820_01535 [Acidobacteria bacterium]|nr:hypothetical protein [Acidobacteriota bacterium]